MLVLVTVVFSYGIIRQYTSTPRSLISELSHQEGFISAYTS